MHRLLAVAAGAGALVLFVRAKSAPSSTVSAEGSRAVQPDAWTVINVPGDGDCLFHSLSLSRSIVDSTPELGARRCRLMANDWLCPGGAPSGEAIEGLPIEFIMEPRGVEGGGGYCRRLRRQGEWGGAAEITALAQVWKRPIQVYVRQPPAGFKLLAEYGASQTQNAAADSAVLPIPILYVNAAHYMALRRTGGGSAACDSDDGPAAAEGEGGADDDWSNEFHQLPRSRL
jgi:hypothetical protein